MIYILRFVPLTTAVPSDNNIYRVRQRLVCGVGIASNFRTYVYSSGTFSRILFSTYLTWPLGIVTSEAFSFTIDKDIGIRRLPTRRR